MNCPEFDARTFQKGVTTILAQNLNYLPFGPAQNWLLGNSITVTRSYDQDYRLTQLTDTGILNRTLAYDTRNNITGIADNLDASRSQSFGYDVLSRLTSATGHYGSLGWTYDGVGNRLSETRNGVTDNYSYPSTSHRLQSTTAQNFTYDPVGNVTQKGNQTLSYNAAGRLASATDNAVIPQSQSYAYSTDGLRRSKTSALDTTHFIYDSTGTLLAEASGLGVPQVEYVWLYGQPLAMIANGLINYVHADHIQTPQKLTNLAQQAVWDGIYEPFGNVNLFTNLADNNLRFPGQYFDAESGLHQNWNRDYDPGIGRYVQSDPIGLEGGINTYAYVGNKPLTMTDRSGLAPFPELPKTADCKVSEWRECESRCKPGRVKGCYVTRTWRLMGIRDGEPIRVEERTVNCDCCCEENESIDWAVRYWWIPLIPILTPWPDPY